MRNAMEERNGSPAFSFLAGALAGACARAAHAVVVLRLTRAMQAAWRRW
jgi:hypothetical protein